jgi:AbrB family looped-hinge helix DNA binding protein
MSHGKHFGKHKKQHFFSSVKVGAKGQIVIPNEIRAMFDIKPGDSLIIVATEHHGIGIVKDSMMYNVTLDVLNKIGITDKQEKLDDPDEASDE